MANIPLRRNIPPRPAQQDEPIIIAEARINRGMDLSMDPADLPNGMLTLAKNATVYLDRTYATPGNVPITPTKPDSNPILVYTGWKRFSGSTELIRITKDKIYKNSGVSWTEVTGTALTGNDTDRIRWITTADLTTDYFIYTNNGVDEIQVTNSALTTHADLGNAPKARYICAFFNRIVAANIRGGSPNPILLMWSGDLNFDEWNPTNDISAGSMPLMEAQADFSDAITGLFSFATVMLILRERSLWTVTKRPVASNPFIATAAFPSVGCDTPNSATQTRNGICWYDGRANQVYLYEVGGSPQPIGDPIKDLISSSITDKNKIHASYDVEKDTYILTIPSSLSTTTRIFKYNITNRAWTYDEIDNAYGVFHLDGAQPGILINALPGTINSLTGTINSLQGQIQPASTYYGMTDGDINVQSPASVVNSLSMRLESKIYRGNNDTLITDLVFVYAAGANAGSFSTYFRRNRATNWIRYKKTQGYPGRQLIHNVRMLLCNEYQWAFLSGGDDYILEYRLEAVSSLLSRNDHDGISVGRG